MNEDLISLLPLVVDIAKNAGVIERQYFEEGNFTTEKKKDGSLVTNADLLASDCIVNALKQISSYPIISEENEIAEWKDRQKWTRYWLIDPLDGTRGFTKKSEEFTVNIALIENHEAILGVVYVPAKNTAYFAAKNNGAYKQIHNEKLMPIQGRSFSADQAHVLIGHSFSDRIKNFMISQMPNIKFTNVNSSLKFCLIAEGLYDLYCCFGPISEWDTAAGQCILEAAGGAVMDCEGPSLSYNQHESLRSAHFFAIGDKNAVPYLLSLVKNLE